MKSLLCMIMVAVLLSGMASCANKNDSEKQSLNDSVKEEDFGADENSSGIDDSFVPEEWGVQESLVATNNSNICNAFIRFPSLAGIIEGTGKIAYQMDETLVILDSQTKKGSPDVENGAIDAILPAYFAQTIKILDFNLRDDHQNFEFSIESKNMVTINDYEMCKYTGTHTFTLSGEPKSMKYVAYATKLKANDACIYWMVIDRSDDQSLNSTIVEYAEKMAYTFHE